MRPAAYAVLNLEALKNNLTRVRECAPRSKIMAVIKANAYGHGLLQVAATLQEADAFAVARVDEAVYLRQKGIKQRITVLEGFTCKEELLQLLKFDLEVVIHSPGQLGLLESLDRQDKLSVWLKLDSGMNRLGFRNDEFELAYQRLIDCPSVNKPLGLMTHLANADNKKDQKTRQQVALFSNTVKAMEGECSIANSAGILGWQESLADWVRPGIMLFGVSPFPEQNGEQLGVKPVMGLHSRLISVKQIVAGDTVGYGGNWVSQKPTRLGVVAIGYGDGYPRQAVEGTPVLVNNVRVPLVGRVSMDMITVDLGDKVAANPGDSVTLWGNALPVEEIARCADTIPYTLLCGITRRVQIVVE
jgi:alanine racemase